MINEESKLNNPAREFTFSAKGTSAEGCTARPSDQCWTRSSHRQGVGIAAGLLAVFLMTGSACAQGATAAKADPDGIRPSYQICLDKTGGVTPSMQDCISDEYEYQDERLNRAYKSLMNGLDSTGRSSLRAEERKWIAQRDRSCKPPTANDGQAQELMYRSCLLKKSAKRAAALEVRAR